MKLSEILPLISDNTIIVNFVEDYSKDAILVYNGEASSCEIDGEILNMYGGEFSIVIEISSYFRRIDVKEWNWKEIKDYVSGTNEKGKFRALHNPQWNFIDIRYRGAIYNEKYRGIKIDD